MLRKQSILPSEYQQVEWIGGTGTQWIRTDFVPSVGQSTICKFSAEAYPTPVNYVFYALYAAGTSPKQVFASIGYSNSWQMNVIYPARMNMNGDGRTALSVTKKLVETFS
jgi:hypothetical protein